MRIEGRFVRRERETLGLTLRQLSRSTEIPVFDLIGIEDGAPVDIPEPSARRLASALGLQVHDLAKEEQRGEAGLFSC